MDAITQCIQALNIGRPQVADKLIMIPLAREAFPPRTYKVLEEAISDETGSVSEISEAGAVPTLLFENKAPTPVLLIDGDTLMGAKQNRTLNLSLLIAAGARTEIPVSCVEAGRWSRTSRHFSPSSDHMYASGRSRMMHDVHRSIDAGHGPRADQHEVWGDIDRKMGRMGVTSPTRTMTDIYEQRGRSLDAMVGQLTAAPDQVGAIFVVRDRIAGLELFDHPETLALKLPKLVRSYGLDAIDESAAFEPSSISTSEAFLQGIARAQRSEDPAVGLGAHIRLQGAGLIGSGLVMDGRLIRLSAFPSAARA
jgi:ARG/rhodanese/phosphatase superfamily protein